MAISLSFFLVYSRKKILADGLHNTPVSIRCQLRYTRSHLNWSAARRLGHAIERIQFTTPLKAIPRLWNNGKVKHTHPNNIQINSFLDAMTERAIAAHARYIAEGAFPADAQFIADVLGAEQTPIHKNDLLSRYDDYITYLTDRRVSPTLIKKHRHIRGLLEQFSAAARFPLTFDNIGKTFATRFAAWCETLPTRQRAQRMEKTAQYYLDRLKLFFSHAHSEGWTTSIAWRQIKPQIPKSRFPITVTEAEIQRLWALTAADLSCGPRQAESVLLTRDWFIFGTQTCMRFVDWKMGKFKILDIAPSMVNLQVVHQKTAAPVEIPLSALAVAVLDRHGRDLPPVHSPTAVTKHLRILAAAAGIRKHLTTHAARRTFCTLQEAAGVPRSIIMRIGGWQQEAVYLRYTGITFALNAELMRRANPEMFKSAG